MQLGMIGLGRMGANMVRRLLKGGHQCVVFDRSPKAVQELTEDKAVGASSFADFVKKLERPRAVWLELPPSMRMSPFSSRGRRSAMDVSTTAAGTINHTALGLSSFFTKSASEEAPTALSWASSCTAFGDMSKTTH